jgi:hypothetical protein
VYRRSSQHIEAVSGFLAALEARGYTRTPPAPLTAGDVSVSYVNANVTPFKDRMAEGATLGRTCQYQECLRANGAYPWCYTFGMVGAVVDGEHLTGLCTDTVAALGQVLGTTRADRLGALVDTRDADLVNAMTPAAAEHNLPLVRRDAADLDSRWTYGAQYPMAGRGLTLCYRHRDQPCGPACRPGCGCGGWQELGNIIAISTPHRGYAEAGIGVEAMLATRYGGDQYRIPEIRDTLEQLMADGWPAGQAAELVNLHRAVERLTHHGAVPGPRGAGHVLRRMAARLGELHAANPAAGGLAEYAAARGADPPAVELLLAEEARRAAGRNRRLLAAAALLRRRPATTDDRLRETYGLSKTEIAEARHA